MSQLHYHCLQVPKPPLSNLDDQMKYTDNEAYFNFSHEQPATVKSGVKSLSDNKNDGKELSCHLTRHQITPVEDKVELLV